MIEIRHLSKKFPASTPLNDVSVTINDGDIISVIGPSGSGKSTLLRCINLLEKPTSGEILVDGVSITDRRCNKSEVRKRMGMVFQSYNLFGHLTVIENIMLPQMDLLKLDRQAAYKKAMRLLELVGMEGRALQYPDVLSGGQKQRVAIARALSTNPDILLLDEPTSALDPTNVGEVQAVIRRLANMGKTMIIVSHEMRFAREVSNRVFFLAAGGIYEQGTPDEIFDHPKGELTRRFIRQLKVFEISSDGLGLDVPELLSGIDRFCFEQNIPIHLAGKIRSAAEELTAQILRPELRRFEYSAVIEYDPARRTAYEKFRYGDRAFDPRSSGNTAALSILNHTCPQIEYNAVEDGNFKNEVILHVKTMALKKPNGESGVFRKVKKPVKELFQK